MSSIDVGAAIKCAFKLTYDQYDGIRNILSHEFDEAAKRHRPKHEPKSGMKRWARLFELKIAV